VFVVFKMFRFVFWFWVLRVDCGLDFLVSDVLVVPRRVVSAVSSRSVFVFFSYVFFFLQFRYSRFS